MLIFESGNHLNFLDNRMVDFDCEKRYKIITESVVDYKKLDKATS
jgi:hypothetical protein